MGGGKRYVEAIRASSALASPSKTFWGRMIWNLTALKQDRTVQISAEEGGVAVTSERGADPMRRRLSS